MKTKILMVDDDSLIRAIINDILSDAGYEVIESEDGVKVPYLLDQEKPKLLIIDLVMPDREGIETILHLRKDYPYLPIIAISSNSNYLEYAADFGANAILKKPIDANKLLNLVDDLLLTK